MDGHSHSTIASTYVVNDQGYTIPLSSTGTKLKYIGVLNIADSGIVTTTIVDGSMARSKEFDARKTEIVAQYDEIINQVLTSASVELRDSDENGVNMVRTRETNLGDLVADAYRYAGSAEIGLVNGGSIRSGLNAGDLTVADILTCHPFGHAIINIKTTGQQILDALEWASRGAQAEYKSPNGNPIGQVGAFLQVSGLRYTIDTSIESPAIADDKDLFFGIIEDAPRRVSDVEVEKDGVWTAIDPEAEYIVSSCEYNITDMGDGFTMFVNDEVLQNNGLDYETLTNYLVSLNGDLSAYAEPQGRITIK